MSSEFSMVRLTLEEASAYLAKAHGKTVAAGTLAIQTRNGRLNAKKIFGRLTVTKGELDRYAEESAGKPGIKPGYKYGVGSRKRHQG